MQQTRSNQSLHWGRCPYYRAQLNFCGQDVLKWCSHWLIWTRPQVVEQIWQRPARGWRAQFLWRAEKGKFILRANFSFFNANRHTAAHCFQIWWKKKLNSCLGWGCPHVIFRIVFWFKERSLSEWNYNQTFAGDLRSSWWSAQVLNCSPRALAFTLEAPGSGSIR